MLKRFLTHVATLVFLLTAASLGQVVEVAVLINGTKLAPEPPPILVKDQIFVPMRTVFQAMGAEVRAQNGKVFVQRGTQVVILDPKTGDTTVNGKKIKTDGPPEVFEGHTYVSLRFVADAFGDSVNYDAKTKTVTVSPAEDPIGVPPDRVAILKTKLKQLVVGNQGAILKVRDPSGSQEVYYRGLDDRDTAPYDAEDHSAILSAVGLQSDLKRWINDSIEAYSLLPKRETIAFLGIVYSLPNSSPLDPGPEIDEKVERFLMTVVAEDNSVIMRRQALLSMAVGEPGDPEVLESVLQLFERSENLWETFPVQQYFQYHADVLRQMPNFASIRARVAAVNSLYTANILQYLDGAAQ